MRPSIPEEGSFAEARYVDSENGNDAADGKSPDAAWRSLARVNEFIPRASTRIAFKRGGSWRGSLALHGGNTTVGWVAYGAYGEPTGPKPLFLGSIDVSTGWSDADGDGVWEHPWEEDASLPTADEAQGPGNLYFLDVTGEVVRSGFRKQTRAQLAAEGDFFYAAVEHKLQLVSNGRPTGRIEAALNRTQASFDGQALLVVEDCEFRFGGGYALRGHEAEHLRFRRIDVSWIGGGTKRGEYVRLGNGLEFTGTVTDATVEDSRFFQIYDSGLASQSVGAARFVQRDITFRRNIVSRTGLASFELWGRGAEGSQFDKVRFENNTCLFAGGGWGFAQHDHVGQAQVGSDLLILENTASVSGLVVRNNLFVQPQVAFFAEYQTQKVATRKLVDDLTLDFNLYVRPTKYIAVLYAGDDPVQLPESQKFSTLEQWRGGALAKEAHGLEGDPAFASLTDGNPFRDDLRLTDGSPALTGSADGGSMGALGR